MKIEICKLEPDDIILISAKLPLTAILIQHIQSCFPNHKVKIIPADFDIKVLRDDTPKSAVMGIDYPVKEKLEDFMKALKDPALAEKDLFADEDFNTAAYNEIEDQRPEWVDAKDEFDRKEAATFTEEDFEL